MLVLLTDQDTYFVEYLLGELVLDKSITKAMQFDTQIMAEKFQFMLMDKFELNTSINTFID